MDYFDILLAKKLSGGGGGDIDVESLTATENRTYNAGTGKAYNPVVVNLPLGEKTITVNGEYNASADDLKGYSKVTVNVEGYQIKSIANVPTDIASFTDGTDLPMLKLEVGIEAVQSGSGDPSPQNVRPIVGKNAVNVLNLDLPNGNYMASDRQISFAWKDGDTEYDMPFNVMANEVVKDSGDNDVDVLTLESEYVLPFDIVYDAPEAIIALDSNQTLSAGDYYFKIANDSWGENNNKYVSFTLDSALSGTMQIRKMSGAYNSAIENCTLGIYTSGNDTVGTALAFTVGTTKPSSGTSLGQTDGSGDLNHWHCVALGYNRYKYSALRQYLNADTAKNTWWVQQHKWDVMPAYATTKDGFLYGLSADVKAKIKTTKIVTARNTVYNSGDTPLGDNDITYDKVFPASLEQMYISPQVEGEGEAWEYYKLLNGTSTPYQRSSTYADLIKYGVDAKRTARYRWLRSCIRGYAFNGWYVNSSGRMGTNSANNAFRVAPCLRIGINDKKSITWSEAGTVYGGYLTFYSDGRVELTVDWVKVDFKDLTFDERQRSSDVGGIYFRASITDKAYSDNDMNELYTHGTIANPYNTKGNYARVFKTTGFMYVGFADEENINSLSDFNTWVTNNPTAALAYKIENPTTYQLTPTQVTTLLGNNNIWADTGDILEGEYFVAL